MSYLLIFCHKFLFVLIETEKNVMHFWISYFWYVNV